MAASYDGASHSRIFPTLLALMGYPAERITPFYGPSLLSSHKEALSFTPSYNASLGRGPSWRAIVRAELAAPPASDYVQVASVR